MRTSFVVFDTCEFRAVCELSAFVQTGFFWCEYTYFVDDARFAAKTDFFGANFYEAVDRAVHDDRAAGEHRASFDRPVEHHCACAGNQIAADRRVFRDRDVSAANDHIVFDVVQYRHVAAGHTQVVADFSRNRDVPTSGDDIL